MAIAFARARYLSRSTGGNACRSASYNAREAIADLRTGERYSFAHRDAPEHLQALGRIAASPLLEVHPSQVRRGPGHNTPQQGVAQRDGQGRQAGRVAAAGDGVEHGEGGRGEHEELEQEDRGDGGRVPQDEDGHRDPQVRGVDVAGGERADGGLGGGAVQHEAVEAPGRDDGRELGVPAPREVVDAVEAAYRAGRVPLAAAEGYIRQILGWREYVRGVYWTQMPHYADSNALQATGDLPGFYWTGDAPMPCLADALRQTLDLGYAHHIQRLMVIGLYAQLLGVEPAQVHRWFLAVYVDAVEWVEMPNVLGMSQYADGGLMSSKPYIASGRYIERMSAGSYCRGCVFDPGQRTGPDACPYTRLYWDFMLRHEPLLAANPRTRLQVRALERLDADERAVIRREADAWREAAVHRSRPPARTA